MIIRDNKGRFSKGNIPYFKGKKIPEDVKNKIRQKNKGKHYSPKTEFKKGHISWLKNKHLPDEVKEKIRKTESETKIKMFANGELIPWNKGKVGLKKHSELTIEKISKRLRENNPMKRPEVKKRMEGENNPAKRPELRKKKREEMIKKWQDQDFREKRINAQLRGLFKRPTSLEKQFIEFIEKYKLPFSYCGDGTLMIGYKCPDFYENNGKKICIETANKIEKSIKRKHRPYQSWQEYEEQRIEHFTKWGWKCIVIWQDELNKQEELLKRIGDVLNV